MTSQVEGSLLDERCTDAKSILEMKKASEKTNLQLLDTIQDYLDTYALESVYAFNLLKKRLGYEYEINNIESKETMLNDGYPENEIIPITKEMENEYFV